MWSVQMRAEYHEAGAQQQAVQGLSHVSRVDVAVVRVVVPAVSSLQRGQELRQARDGDLQHAWHHHHQLVVSSHSLATTQTDAWLHLQITTQ